MEDERKTKIANVLIKEHNKLPLTIKEKEFMQWGDKEHRIKLGVNINGEILLSFGFSDLEGFDYLYSQSDDSYKSLISILELDQEIMLGEAHSSNKHIKKVVTVMVFYHSEMKRVKEI